MRSRSFTPQAAPISLVGSLVSSIISSRFHCFADRWSAPVSSSRRFTHTGSATVPRRPSCSRVTRCRTSVTIWLARATRCHLSTAINASGRAARMPEAYGADGSMTTISTLRRNASVCSPSQSRTHAPVRPGAKPSSDPGPSREQSTNEVSHGSDRFQVISSRTQRTDRNRVSSIPNRVVGTGSGSHLAAAATSALCAVRHDTPYSAATSETARLLDAIARATCSRSRSVTRARGRIALDSWVNDLRRHNASRQTSRRFRHHNCTRCPHARRSWIRTSDRSFTRRLNTPQPGHGPSRDSISMMILTCPESARSTLTTSNSSWIPNSTDVAFGILAASLLDVVGDQQHVGAASPHRLRHEPEGTPLKFEDPVYRPGSQVVFGHSEGVLDAPQLVVGADHPGRFGVDDI